MSNFDKLESRWLEPDDNEDDCEVEEFVDEYVNDQIEALSSDVSEENLDLLIPQWQAEALRLYRQQQDELADLNAMSCIDFMADDYFDFVRSR